MLNNNGFNLWANDYDKSVNLSEEANEYPFAGYKKVLDTIYRKIRSGNGHKILDVGFGTGILSKKLYDDGCEIFGIDFSEKMIEIAKEKMPDAIFIRHDFSQGMPKELASEKFDFIVCTYAIHHLNGLQKQKLITEFSEHLTENGAVLIGDVAFETCAGLERCKADCGAEWDNEEIYPVLEELERDFPEIQFEKISFCAGVFTLQKV